MRRHDAAGSAGYLCDDVAGNSSPREAPFERDRERDGWIEVSARDRSEGEDQCEQHRAGRDAVSQEGDRHVPAGELHTHDAGADDGRQEEGRSDSFGHDRAQAYIRMSRYKALL